MVAGAGHAMGVSNDTNCQIRHSLLDLQIDCPHLTYLSVRRTARLSLEFCTFITQTQLAHIMHLPVEPLGMSAFVAVARHEVPTKRPRHLSLHLARRGSLSTFQTK